MTLPVDRDGPGIIAGGKRHLAAAAVTGCLSCLILCSQVLSGCIHTTARQPVAYKSLDKSVIAEEVVKTETVLSQMTVKNTAGKNKKAELLLRLAMLYAHPDNPDMNYHRAADYLEQYSELGNAVDPGFALSLIIRLSQCLEDKSASCRELKEQNSALERQCDDLTRENHYHIQVIEKLKSLDIQLEKKRKALD